MTTLVAINSSNKIQTRLAEGRIPRFGPLLMLFTRSALLLLVQGVFLLLFLQLRVQNAAVELRNWWSVFGTLVDVGCLGLLIWLTGREGIHLQDLVGFVKSKLKTDVLFGLGIFAVIFPLTVFGGGMLAMLIVYGRMNPVFPEGTFIRTLPLAAVLYPDGIQTDAAYERVCEVAEKACAHIGYGPEVELGPPTVPFSQRGSYRKRYPPVDGQMMRDELERVGTGSTYPRQEVACTVLWNKAGLAVYGRHWSALTLAEQEMVQAQVDEIVGQAGWTRDDSSTTGRYIKPLPIDESHARSRLSQFLGQQNGRPVSVSTIIYQVQVGAYGRGFYADDLEPALEGIIIETLQARGYHSTPQAGEYLPLPVTISAEMEIELSEQLAAIEPVTTTMGQGLMWQDVLAVVKAGARVNAMSEWQANQLLESGPVRQALRHLGYCTSLTWCQPYQFEPRLEDGKTHEILLKEIRIQNDHGKRLTLAKGLSILAPALVIDDQDDTLVYLEMVGAKRSVKANWAALVGGGKVHWLGRQRIRLDGMKAHVKIQTTLPCGWADQILLHKQASLREMNPEEPFYLLDDGLQQIPPLFYAMLNKALALPLLESWSEHLWENGRERDLIHLLDEGQGQGYGAWRVLPGPDMWQEVISNGLRLGQLAF